MDERRMVEVGLYVPSESLPVMIMTSGRNPRPVIWRPAVSVNAGRHRGRYRSGSQARAARLPLLAFAISMPTFLRAESDPSRRLSRPKSSSTG
jgi:hypothetical protein